MTLTNVSEFVADTSVSDSQGMVDVGARVNDEASGIERAHKRGEPPIAIMGLFDDALDLEGGGGKPEKPVLPQSTAMSDEDLAAAIKWMESQSIDVEALLLKATSDSSRMLDSQRTLIGLAAKITGQEMDAKAERNLKLLADAAEKDVSIASQSKQSKILGWIGRIAAVVASLAAVVAAGIATFFSGGAAVPALALAGAALIGSIKALCIHAGLTEIRGIKLDNLISGAMTAVMKLALKAVPVSDETKEKLAKMVGPALLVALAPQALLLEPGILGAAFQGFAELCGADESQAAIVNTVFTMVAVALTIAATMVLTGGVGSAKALSDGAKLMGEGAKLVDKVALFTKSASSVVQGGTALMEAGVGVSVGFDEKDLAEIHAKRHANQAEVTQLRQSTEMIHAQLKKLMELFSEGTERTSKVMQEMAQSRELVVHNLGSSMA